MGFLVRVSLINEEEGWAVFCIVSIGGAGKGPVGGGGGGGTSVSLPSGSMMG